MNKVFICISFMLFFSTAFSQSPQKLNYQAVIRDNSGQVVSNRLVKVRISILKGSASGSVVYREVHSIQSSSNGIMNVIVGDGSEQNGSISGIDWGSGNYHVKVEVDPSNGTNYTITGASQLLSVPYALFADKSGVNERVIQFGTNVGDTIVLPANADIFSTYDGGHNRWVQLPSKTAANDFLKNRRNTLLLLTSYSTFDFRILPIGTDLKDELIINTYEYALFVFDNEVWKLVSSSRNHVPTGGQEGQVLTMCGGYPSWGPCVPRLKTHLTEIRSTTAKSGGTITYTAGLPVTARGVVWSTNPLPTIALSTKTIDGSGSGSFTSDITGLLPNTTYYVRAYATTANGTGYGYAEMFKTTQ